MRGPRVQPMKWSVLSRKLLYSGFFKLTALELRHDLFDGGESPVLTRELLDRRAVVDQASRGRAALRPRP